MACILSGKYSYSELYCSELQRWVVSNTLQLLEILPGCSDSCSFLSLSEVELLSEISSTSKRILIFFTLVQRTGATGQAGHYW